MTQTLASEYTTDRAGFRENPQWDLNAPVGCTDAIRLVESNDNLLIMPQGLLPAPAQTGFRLLYQSLARWLKTCADHYAAAAAYDDLSRLSDVELGHRGLSRDVLARDLRDWGA